MSINKDILGDGMNVLAVGAQGRGKSNCIKNLLSSRKYSGRDNWRFDPNLEYKMQNKARNIYTRNEFLEQVPHHKNSSVNVVFEEASGFFPKSGSMPISLINHICRRSHTNNLNIFSYHALTQFNSDNLIYIDYIILYRTQEKPKRVYENFDGYDKILAGYEDVMSKTENTYFDRRNKIYPDERSRKFYHYNQIIQVN